MISQVPSESCAVLQWSYPFFGQCFNAFDAFKLGIITVCSYQAAFNQGRPKNPFRCSSMFFALHSCLWVMKRSQYRQDKLALESCVCFIIFCYAVAFLGWKHTKNSVTVHCLTFDMWHSWTLFANNSWKKWSTWQSKS